MGNAFKQLKASEKDIQMKQTEREYFNWTLFIGGAIKGLFRVSKQNFSKDHPKSFYVRIFIAHDVAFLTRIGDRDTR